MHCGTLEFSTQCYDPSRTRRAEGRFCNGRRVDQLEFGIVAQLSAKAHRVAGRLK